jgi:hypothetical protein
MGEAVLWAEAKFGELLRQIEPKYSIGSVEGTNRPYREKTLPEGITKKRSHEAQTLVDSKTPLSQKPISRLMMKIKGTIRVT